MITIDDLITKCVRVKTKNELLELLKKYNGILSIPMIEYLNSLIELDFSVIRNEISEIDREALSELDIYKQVSIYNIYNRALNILTKENYQYSIRSNETNYEGLDFSLDLGNRSIELFYFTYISKQLRYDIPEEYKTMEIGKIHLYQTLPGQQQKKAELDMILEKLDRLYDAKNPYPIEPGIIGGPGTNWIFKHEDQIKYYEERFKELDEQGELSSEDKKEIEITNHIHKLLLDDYGLTNEDFKERNLADNINNILDSDRETKLQHVLTKKLPNLEITNNIKYI